MKKFIKGTFELDTNVTDLAAYEQKKETKILAIIDWCNTFNVAVNMGTSDDNTYLCEYKIVAKTKSMCNSLLRELKEMLKECFPYVKLVWQASGDQLF